MLRGIGIDVLTVGDKIFNEGMVPSKIHPLAEFITGVPLTGLVLYHISTKVNVPALLAVAISEIFMVLLACTLNVMPFSPPVKAMVGMVLNVVCAYSCAAIKNKINETIFVFITFLLCIKDITKKNS